MSELSRRGVVKALGKFGLLLCAPGFGRAASGLDSVQLMPGYALRLKGMLSRGALPYIDIESSCNSSRVDVDAVARQMDELNIGLMALSADIGRDQFARGVRFDNLVESLIDRYPAQFIGVGNGGQPPALTEAPDEFLAAQDDAILRKKIVLLGEYEFRHYPSPRQVRRGDDDRDVEIPIDGPVGHRLFSMSERTGVPFQIHYEIENDLLAPLEKMLAQYPKARVIWCHLAQVRYIERASRYTPAYVEGLIQRCANLYFDTAFAGPNSVYPPSRQRHARVWSPSGGLRSEWRDLIVAHSTRFLSALDLGQDRMDRIAEYDSRHRSFLQRLPTETQHRVAYRNAWSLLFKEEFA